MDRMGQAGIRWTRQELAGGSAPVRSEAPDSDDERPSARRRPLRESVGAAAGVLLGLVPHVLHHVGLLVGTAVVVGAGGTVALYVVGLLLTVPLLRRLRRRFSTWLAPAVAVAVFTGAFALSTFVVGPAISGARAPNSPSFPTSPSSPARVGQLGPAGSVTPTEPAAPSRQAADHAGHHR